MITGTGLQVIRSCARVGLLATWLGASFSVLGVADDVRAADVVTPQITIDQFGWLPRSLKVAILADPVRGQNVGMSYHPGPRFEVRQESGGTVAYRGVLKPWNDGRVSELAGDRVWHADFSALRTPGNYYLY